MESASHLLKLAKGLTLSLLALVVLAPSAHALKFSNQFVEFELPNKWKCGLEGAEWVCQSEDEHRKRDAIVVLAAKLKGDQDTLEKYQEYLKKPRAFSGPGGKSVSSDPKYAANKTINGQLWVDSLHLQSEIPDFFTRYLATVKDDIGVLVTYSVNKAKFQEYQKQFEDMVASIKVFRKKGGLLAASGNNFTNTSAAISGSGIFQPIDTNAGAAKAATHKAAGGGGAAGGGMGLIILLAAGAGGFIYWKKKKAAGG